MGDVRLISDEMLDHYLSEHEKGGTCLATPTIPEWVALARWAAKAHAWLHAERERTFPHGRGYMLHSHGCKSLTLDPIAMAELDIGEYATYGDEHCTCGLGALLAEITPPERQNDGPQE